MFTSVSVGIYTLLPTTPNQPSAERKPRNMETISRTYIKSLAHRGTIQGVTISTSSSSTSNAKDLCHYFGGVRYGLAPAERWRRAQPLPASFTYGSEEAPGRCNGGAGLCPQPGFRHTPENPDAWNEDCFQCNVWTPVGDVPEGGWPVFVFIRECCFTVIEIHGNRISWTEISSI